ncbi:MAG: hypothetical protein ABJ381_20645, partial [Ilumatobacter sp.]|uniref:hypothetical protein n=1 Tax=Ilumatobacter sp. TaxID=1967498 RepID=UPI003299CD59
MAGGVVGAAVVGTAVVGAAVVGAAVVGAAVVGAAVVGAVVATSVAVTVMVAVAESFAPSVTRYVMVKVPAEGAVMFIVVPDAVADTPPE